MQIQGPIRQAFSVEKFLAISWHPPPPLSNLYGSNLSSERMFQLMFQPLFKHTIEAWCLFSDDIRSPMTSLKK